MSEKSVSTRRTVKAVVVALALLFVTTACQSTLEPSAEKLENPNDEGLQEASFKPDSSLRVRYLPPIGNGAQVKHGEFANGLPIEMAVFALSPDDAEATGLALETHVLDEDDVVSLDGDTYRIAWPVLDPTLAERVRVEIRMVGSGNEPVCNEYEGECLGYLDVRIVEEGGKGRGGGSSARLITVPSGEALEVQFKVLVATNLEEMATLSGQGGLDPEDGSCPVDELGLPSQGLQAVGAGLQAVGAGLQAVGAGLQAVGAAGGLFASPLTGDDSLEGRFVELAALADILVDFDDELDDVPGYNVNKVVMFVLDDFGGDFTLPANLLAGDIVLPSDGTLDYEYSHGALVFHQLRTMLESLFGPGHASPDSYGPYYVDFGGKHGKLRLQAVDARDGSGHIDTDVATQALKKAMKGAYHDGFRRAVVNMSFSIVPCAVKDDFAVADAVTFEEYVLALMAYNGVSGETAQKLTQTVREPVESLDDPLLDHLGCPRFADYQPCGANFHAIVNVAASGNYGLGFPLFPAAAPGVVSVGSQRFEDGFLSAPSAFSNAAAIVAAGDVVLLRADSETGNGLAYIGTSFSAPYVSLFVALDQRDGSQTCDGGDPGDPVDSPPALATTALANLPLLPGLTPDGSGASAVQQYCGAGG